MPGTNVGGGAFSNLMQNKMFLQYLAAGGQDILGGQPIGANVNAVTQQNISSQNFMKMLQKMLGGEVPEGGVVKMTDKGLSLNVPQSALGQGGFGGLGMGNPGSYTPDTGMTTITPGPQPMTQGAPTNPFVTSQPSFSGADLAGVTPEMISQALQLKQTQEQIGQKKISDVMDMMYKGAAIDKMYADMDRVETPNMSGFSYPGLGTLNMDQFKALTPEQKEYASYFTMARNRGDSDIMTPEEFSKEFDKTEKEKFLRSAQDDPSLFRTAKELAEAGSTKLSIGERVADKLAMGTIEGELYFKSPKWTDDINKHMSSEDVQNKLFNAEDKSYARAEEQVKFIESKIIAGGGTIQDVKLSEDGTSMIWTVRWPSGNVENITHGIGS